MKRDYLEEDMYDVVKDHFVSLGYQVQGEVRACDVIAVKEDTLIILELKKSLSLELLVQSVKRQKLGALTYLCVPKPRHLAKNRKFQDLLYLLKRLGLGLIFCEPEREALEVMLHPEAADQLKSRQINRSGRQRLLKEIEGRKTSLNRGGSRGKKLMTAYREDAIKLLWLCARHEFIAPKDGVRLGIKKTPSILRDNHYGWFEKTGRGRYVLTEGGKSALDEYRDVVSQITSDLIMETNE